MMLLMGLVLSILMVSDIAAGQQTSTHMDQDLVNCSPLDEQDCSGGFIYFGHCNKFVLEKRSWIDAELHCRTLAPGGHLASIHSEEQNQIIIKNSSPSTNFWIGLNDIYKEGTYLWTDGSSSDFMNWKMNQPDNHNDNEHCVHSVGKSGSSDLESNTGSM
ncbi:lectin-like [Chiloscyllium punctatum]|uniref:lectin-like n=1 Tax=Chiloscyllium punctatum TaxID=137246 RepID=UPI003B63CCF6